MTLTVPGDARFYARNGPFSVSQIAEAAGGSSALCQSMLAGVAPLHSAGPSDVSFLGDRRYGSLLEHTLAGAVIVSSDMADRVPAGSAPIVAGSVSEAWARVLRLFHPLPPVNPGLHPTAFVEAGASIDPTSEIGPFAYIGDGVQIGARCRIGSHVMIESGVVIGDDCRIGAGAVVSHALIGAGAYLHPGVRVGQDGFGLTPTAEGIMSIPQIGRVVIGDNVEIGANSTIDRGALGDTVIGAGCRLDNLVQIGHNVKLGRCCVIVAQVGIAGSTTLEDFVQVGGQAAIAGHLTIGAGAQVGGKAGVMSDLEPKAVVFGVPAQPKTQFFRQLAWVRRMAAAARVRPGQPHDA